jgi:hypothetical protein
MVKGTKNPLGDVPEFDSQLCAFCNGKELATLSVTGMSFPMGDNCHKKSIDRNVSWDDNTTLKELKSLLRQRKRG